MSLLLKQLMIISPLSPPPLSLPLSLPPPSSSSLSLPGYRTIKLRNTNWDVMEGATLLVEIRVQDWVGPSPKTKVYWTYY